MAVFVSSLPRSFEGMVIKLFNEFDKDLDGVLNIDEFNCLVHACQETEPMDSDSFQGLLAAVKEESVVGLSTPDVRREGLVIDDLIQIYLSEDLSKEMNSIIACDYDAVFSIEEEIRALLNRFDVDRDGALNLSELSALNLITEGSAVPTEIYEQICEGLGIENPSLGLQYDHLHMLYTTFSISVGANICTDYHTVFSSSSISE